MQCLTTLEGDMVFTINHVRGRYVVFNVDNVRGRYLSDQLITVGGDTYYLIMLTTLGEMKCLVNHIRRRCVVFSSSHQEEICI